MEAEVSAEQPENAYSPMVATPGMVTEVRVEQLKNASSPMEVTVSGMVMEVRAEQFWNAFSPMEATGLLTTTLLTSLFIIVLSSLHDVVPLLVLMVRIFSSLSYS